MLPLGAGTRWGLVPVLVPPPLLLSPWTLCREEGEGVGFSRSLFQVWVIADKVQGSHSLSRGTVCRRTGVQSLEPKGQGWDYGIGGGWDHLSIRASATRAPRSSSQKPASKQNGQPPSVAGGPWQTPGPVCC